MKDSWMRLSAAFVARTRRERALMLACALVLVGGLGGLLFVQPALARHDMLARQMDRDRHELDALQPQVGALLAHRRDPDAAVRAQLDALHREMQLTDAEFDHLRRALVSPQEMGALLEGLLRGHAGLQLVGLHSVPVTSVSDLIAAPKDSDRTADKTADAAAKDAWLYRHGVQITVRGRYADLQSYLDELEKLPRRVYWGELKLDARQWPDTELTVTVYTISLEKTWWRV